MTNAGPQQPPYPYGYGYAYPYPYGSPTPPPPPPPHRSNRKRALVGVGAALIGAGVVVATVMVASGNGSVVGSGSIGNSQLPDGNRGGYFPFPNGNAGSGGSTNQTSASVATSTQQRGVAIINSVLGLQGEISAGTGMIVTSNGEIVTNNHVVQGATRIVVTIASTNARYSAKVVGTDPTDDVAVIQLSGASGLQTAQFDNGSGTVHTGDKVTAVGNAGGTGTLTAASGSVVATGRSITAADDQGANAEQLHNLIQVDAQVVAGDSGGPLYASDGDIVGMDTAASQSGSATAGFAIPINTALSIAAQIETGVPTAKIHIGTPGLLGVSVANASGGAEVLAVVPGDAADNAGIQPGDLITRVGNTTIGNARDLHNTIGKTTKGQRITVTWTDTSGSSHSATVTLGAGPAD